jgi:uncharacterized protein GlcG (DUF336 family)
MAKELTLQTAERVIEAARKRAHEIATPMSISVVDSGANLVAFVRMDDCLLVATEVAHAKAETAVGFRTATRDLTAAVQPGAPLYGIEVIGRGRLAFFGGGIPSRGRTAGSWVP